MDNIRLSSYLDSLESEDITILTDIASYAASHNLPIARRETVSFLKTVIKAIHPRSILEIGCCVGYSAIQMAEAAGNVSITTIEINHANADIAQNNFSAYKEINPSANITLIEDDATSALPGLTCEYDLIFMDAAKGQYINWLPDALRLLRHGGVLISDNVLQDMTLLESRFAVERRDRTIHERMRTYLYTLKHTEGLTTSIVNTGDGVAFTVKE
ncbi:MAG: O-methyltransferase [Lachnospiraceae bacterium]|nr:O-methyltransferase [Candidatus Minthocola equi]